MLAPHLIDHKFILLEHSGKAVICQWIGHQLPTALGHPWRSRNGSLPRGAIRRSLRLLGNELSRNFGIDLRK